MVAVVVLFDFTTNFLQRRYQIGCCFRAIAMNGAPIGHSKSDFLDNLWLSGGIGGLSRILLVSLLQLLGSLLLLLSGLLLLLSGLLLLLSGLLLRVCV